MIFILVISQKVSLGCLWFDQVKYIYLLLLFSERTLYCRRFFDDEREIISVAYVARMTDKVYLKIVLLGKVNSGKTCLVTRYLTDTFSPEQPSVSQKQFTYLPS